MNVIYVYNDRTHSLFEAAFAGDDLCAGAGAPAFDFALAAVLGPCWLRLGPRLEVDEWDDVAAVLGAGVTGFCGVGKVFFKLLMTIF